MIPWPNLLRRWLRPKPPVIKTTIDGQEYAVTESARAQAAINMRLDPAKRQEVEELIGEAKARRNYPEAYE